MPLTNKPRLLTLALCGIYLVVLYWTIVLKFNLSAYHAGVERSMNWIPFPGLFGLPGQGDLNESLLNIFIFIPFGLYAEILIPEWPLQKKTLLFFLSSFFFEISQYLFKYGAFDSTDLINNTLGGILGIGLFSGFEKVLKSRIKAQTLVNLLCLIGTVLILSILLFLKLNHLWIFRMQLLER
ncbi:VanZ family protein [Algoriphagus sp. AK58]|uniref:VanZ family protein n=1 Tax=Algoriphagus sp. AK58 TaxID=1406877 RepID=UPI00164EE831|nr:VanZ family protein [Algoriphagus sp. AK58]